MPASDAYLSRINALSAETAALLDTIATEEDGAAHSDRLTEAIEEARDALDDPDFDRASTNTNALMARVNSLDSALSWLCHCVANAAADLSDETVEAAETARSVLDVPSEVHA
jgi:hypothetical protein